MSMTGIENTEEEEEEEEDEEDEDEEHPQEEEEEEEDEEEGAERRRLRGMDPEEAKAAAVDAFSKRYCAGGLEARPALLERHEATPNHGDVCRCANRPRARSTPHRQLHPRGTPPWNTPVEHPPGTPPWNLPSPSPLGSTFHRPREQAE